ncbi:MAG: DNA-3-methyladenine glycosylase I, partial [Candidatus Dormiibacterota bacterium]
MANRNHIAASAEVRARCQWATGPWLTAYHDLEWGVPVHEDSRHLELLILEGAQAGLSWLTVLKRRDGYRHAFSDFDPTLVA